MPRVEANPFPHPDGLIGLGPTIRVHVGFDSKFAPDSEGTPQAQLQNLPALVDTGATISSIDSELAQDLNLPLVDQQDVLGVGGKHTMPMFLAQIHVPDLEFTIYGKFVGAHLAQGGQFHKVLLGRTFLRHCVMIYDGHENRVALLT